MTTFNAIPSNQAGMLSTALREGRTVKITYVLDVPIDVSLTPIVGDRMGRERVLLTFFDEGRVSLEIRDAVNVVCALFDEVECEIEVEDKEK